MGFAKTKVLVGIWISLHEGHIIWLTGYSSDIVLDYCVLSKISLVGNKWLIFFNHGADIFIVFHRSRGDIRVMVNNVYGGVPVNTYILYCA